MDDFDLSTNERRAKHAASLGYDWENDDGRMAHYEWVRDHFLTAGLGDLLPAGFDKEHVQISMGSPVEAIYRPTLEFSAMKIFSRRADGAWFARPSEIRMLAE